MPCIYLAHPEPESVVIITVIITAAFDFCFLSQGAGYRSNPRGKFDPLNQAASGGGSRLDAKMQTSPEEQCLEAEAKVHLALEQSAEALIKGDASAGEQTQS